MRMSPTPQSLTVDIEGIEPSADGAGYAWADGRRLTVAGVAPGERVEVRPVAGAMAELIRVVRASPQRVAPRCRHFGPCGGCAWQHIAYVEQLRLKAEMLRGLLAGALGSRAPRVEPVLPATGDTGPWGFRAKAHFVFGPSSRGSGLVMGHYRRASQTIVPVEECPVHATAGNEVAFAVRDALAAGRIGGATPDLRQGIARHIVVRAAAGTRERLATLVVTRNDKALRPAVRAVLSGPAAPDGFHVNIHARPGPYLFGDCSIRVHGVDRVRERVHGVSFLVSPTAFFQTNVHAAEIMVRLVLEWTAGAVRVLDLYAGAGLFSLPLARRGAKVTAVEESPAAVEDGEASRRLNRIPDTACRFVRARVEDVAAGRPLLPGADPDVVILDPPRDGCPPRVLSWIARRLRPVRLVYVSCNPEALAQDLATLLDAGYSVTRVQPIDMFPHTSHLETVVVLTL